MAFVENMMKKDRILSANVLIVLFIMTMLIHLSNAVYALDYPHSKVYVSSSIGNDTNNGLTTDSPVKTIKKALTMGDTILLKSNDVFYERALLKKQHLSSYGEGKKPELNGLRLLKGRPWKKVGDSIWKIDLTTAESIGFVVKGSSIYNNVGFLYETNKGELHGRKCAKRMELNNDWDFFQSDVLTYHVLKEKCFDELYLYYRDNPNDLDLALSVGSRYGLSLYDSSVDGVSVKGFGTGGIEFKGSSSVRNCRVDAIGGSMMIFGQITTSLGNGIDIWVNKDASDCTIEGNYVTRCYDCGCSIQAEECGQATPRNIVFKNNLITNCCQGWEDFLRNDEYVKFENCAFENNIVLEIGETSGFGYPKNRFKYCHVLGNNFKGDKGMIIRNNTFVGGNYYCSGAYRDKYRSNVWIGNTCVIKRGDYILSNYMGTKDVIRIPTEKGDYRSLKTATDEAIKHYREMTGDYSTRFIIKSEKHINKRIKKLKNRYLKG